MGERRVVPGNRQLSPLQVAYNLTPALATGGRTAGSLGYVPIGYYKGAAAFFDLDKMANQPLAWAERQHILGILDGREEDYDLQTVTVPAGALTGQVLSGTLTVPAGVVFYVSCVELTVGVDPAPGAVLTGFWRCSLWTDRAATPNAAGQLFNSLGDVGNVFHEFGEWTTLLAITNKTPLLRLPAGAVITFTITTVGAASAAIASTLQLYGTVGKALVA
jgi:hypothetical protein